MATVSLYREIDALGGTFDPADQQAVGRDEMLATVLEILARRGFGEHQSPYRGVIDALTPVLDDLGVPGSDGWTDGYVHVTDLDRLQSAIAHVETLA